jgi:hypothetical protein
LRILAAREMRVTPLHVAVLHFNAGDLAMVVSAKTLPLQMPRHCNVAVGCSVEHHVIKILSI